MKLERLDQDFDKLAEPIARAIEPMLTAAISRLMVEQSAGFRRRYFTEPEAAELLAVSASALKKWRLCGSVRASVQRDKLVRYAPEDIDAAAAWLMENGP